MSCEWTLHRGAILILVMRMGLVVINKVHLCYGFVAIVSPCPLKEMTEMNRCVGLTLLFFAREPLKPMQDVGLFLVGVD